jgi:hypothetical protein
MAPDGLGEVATERDQPQRVALEEALEWGQPVFPIWAYAGPSRDH